MMLDATRDKPLVIRIFIVEDYRLIRMGLKYDLDDHPNIEVLGDFDDAESALARLQRMAQAREDLPHVILMDLGLPGMSGIEATQQIKAFCPQMKILMLTSHDEPHEVISSLGAGANGYCLKNTEQERLVEIIKMIADGGAWLDPTVAKVALDLFYQAELHPEILSPMHDPMHNHETSQLSERELEILKLMVAGKSNVEIAREIYLSVHTVKSYVSSIFQKLSVNDRVQAAVKAIKAGLINH